jgi:Family of unknown function (DUF5995)
MATQTIDEIIERLKRIQATLPAGDGVRWFNRLYLDTTLAIRDYCRSARLEAPPFLEQLDVYFGNCYLDSFDAAAAGRPVPKAWSPLFELRSDRRIAPLQFALAGMNAHVSGDLALGVVRICESLGVSPSRDSGQHADFNAVNVVVGKVEREDKKWLLTGALKELDHEVAAVDDAVAIWSIERARDTAWTQAEVLWHLRDHRHLLSAYVVTLEATAAMEGRALLLPRGLQPTPD